MESPSVEAQRKPQPHNIKWIVCDGDHAHSSSSTESFQSLNKKVSQREIWGSHGGNCEDYCHLGCDAV
jgi:hypothetical protein